MSLLTVRQAAEHISVSKSLIYELCATGVLPHVRIGKQGRRGCIRIDPNDLDAFVNGKKVIGAGQGRGPPAKQFKHVVIP